LADVAVVGAGLGGLATAARLAKLGHQVTVFERGDTPGGLLRIVRQEGLTWDATPMQTTVPAVLRDLFRKSGRPLERYVDLQLTTPARRHVFADGTRLDLPTGSRGAQLDAVSDALGEAEGAAWTRFVDDQADVWALLRADVLDPPDGVASLADRRVARGLHLRQSLDRFLRRAFDDERLRQLAAYPAERIGGAAEDEPAFRAVEPYVERSFGVWRLPGGAADLAQALLTRMSERSVDVRFGTEVTSLLTFGDRVSGVALADGSTVDADIIVAAVSPRQVFGRLLQHRLARKAMTLFPQPQKALPRSISYLGLANPVPDLPAEVVLHGNPLLLVSTGGLADEGRQAWTVVVNGAAGRDVLDLMADRRLDIRHAVTTRLDSGNLGSSGGMEESSYSVRWEGARTATARAALASPMPGLLCLGTSLVLGSSIPYVAWQAAHVAEIIGTS